MLLNRPLKDECGPSMTLRVLLGPRDRKNCSIVEIFVNKIFFTRPSSGGGRGAFTISRRAVPSLSGSPVLGPLALPLTARFDGGLDGRGGLPMLLQMQRGSRGGRRGPASTTSRQGRCSWRTGGGSSCLPGQDVLDRLSLLLCSQELLGHVLDCVAEEAGLGHGGLEEPNFVPHVDQTQPEVALLDHKCGHERPRELAVTFVARSVRSVAVRSSFRTSGS